MKSKLPPILFLGVCLGTALLSGCATAGPSVSSHPDTAVNYAGYRSFGLLHPSGLAPARNAAVTPMLVRQMREEAGAAFAAKGLVQKSSAESDLLVLVHGSLQDKLEIQDWDLSYGRLGRGRPGGQEISQHQEGALYVDVFDGRTRELVWCGAVVAEVSAVPDLAQLKTAIHSIVDRYPN